MSTSQHIPGASISRTIDLKDLRLKIILDAMNDTLVRVEQDVNPTLLAEANKRLEEEAAANPLLDRAELRKAIFADAGIEGEEEGERPPFKYNLGHARQWVTEIAFRSTLAFGASADVVANIVEHVLDSLGDVSRPLGTPIPDEGLSTALQTANTEIERGEGMLERFPRRLLEGAQILAAAKAAVEANRADPRLILALQDPKQIGRSPEDRQLLRDAALFSQTYLAKAEEIRLKATGGAGDFQNAITGILSSEATSGVVNNPDASILPVFEGFGTPVPEPFVGTEVESLAGDFKKQLQDGLKPLESDATQAEKNARADLISRLTYADAQDQAEVRAGTMTEEELLRNRRQRLRDAKTVLPTLLEDAEQDAQQQEDLKEREEKREYAQTEDGADAIRDEFLYRKGIDDPTFDPDSLDDASLLALSQVIYLNGGIEGIEGFLNETYIPALQAQTITAREAEEAAKFDPVKTSKNQFEKLFIGIDPKSITDERRLELEQFLSQPVSDEEIQRIRDEVIPAYQTEKENLDLAANTTQLEQAAETALGITARTPTQVRKSLEPSVVELASFLGSDLEKDPQGADAQSILGEILSTQGATPFGLAPRPQVVPTLRPEDPTEPLLPPFAPGAEAILGRGDPTVAAGLAAAYRPAAEVETERLDPRRPPTLSGLPGFSRGRVEKSLALAPTSELMPLLERALFDRPELAEFVSQGGRAQSLQRQVRDIRRDRRNEQVRGAWQSLKPLPLDQRVDAVMASMGIDRKAAKNRVERLAAIHGEQGPVLKDETDPVAHWQALPSPQAMPLQEAFTQAFSSLTREFEATPGFEVETRRREHEAETERRRVLRKSAAQRRTVIRR